MKKINFNLITLSILSFFLCTLFITSCTKEQATFTLPVEMADEDFNVIQINDIDIQEFIRVRNSVVNQSDDNEIEAITMLVDKLITYKENLQEKYPNQQFEDLSVAEFFKK